MELGAFVVYFSVMICCICIVQLQLSFKLFHGVTFFLIGTHMIKVIKETRAQMVIDR